MRSGLQYLAAASASSFTLLCVWLSGPRSPCGFDLVSDPCLNTRLNAFPGFDKKIAQLVAQRSEHACTTLRHGTPQTQRFLRVGACDAQHVRLPAPEGRNLVNLRREPRDLAGKLGLQIGGQGTCNPILCDLTSGFQHASLLRRRRGGYGPGPKDQPCNDLPERQGNALAHMLETAPQGC